MQNLPIKYLKPAADQETASPFVHEFFLVQGVGFRCMAYRSHEGKWRGAFDHQELTGVIRILE